MKSGSRLERILTSGEFAVTGELGPPKNGNAEHVREKARLLKGSVDAVNITDCQTAIVRMSSISAGLLTLAEGVEPVIQMTCRDRNRIGMQSDILGAAALGLKNLLCLTGDHQKFGNHPGSKGVFDMDSIQLLGMVKTMRDEKKFQCGEVIKSHEPKLFLGAAANPFAGPSEQFRAARLAKKVANGADFVQTQIIYNVERFARFMQAVRDLGLHKKVHILAGVTPPKSVGMARYMKSSVPGMDVTDEVIMRMQGAKDKEDEGINICVDIIRQVREIEGVAGVHIMAIEWESAVPEIVSRAGIATRPVFADEPVALAAPVSAIEIRTAAAGGEEGDAVLAAAKVEAEKIIAAAKAEAARYRASASSVSGAAGTSGAGAVDQARIEIEEAGEDAMNEKERQMALDSVRLGLDALKKAYGLSDDQFDALVKFAGAEAILKREPVLAVPASPAPAPVAQAAPAVTAAPAPVQDESAAKKAAEAAAADEAKKAEAAKKGAADKAAEEAKKAEAAKKAAEAAAADEAKKAEAAKKAAADKAAEAAKKPVAPEAKKAAPAASAAAVGAAELTLEKTPLNERAAKVPEASYKQAYTGAIRQTLLGDEASGIKVGGANTLPFHLFEGTMGNNPKIAFDVLDVKPDEWPDSLARHYQDVLDNPVAWAQKCVKEYGADAICISMVSTDPNGLNRPAGEAAKAAAEVVKSIEVPVIVWGCGNGEKDTETLREITSLIGDKKVCLAPLSDSNYRAIGATAMAFRYPMVAASPIDVNLAKQLNILLENLGVSLDSVLIDPSIGALGYGIEYTYSVMERIRLAALTQKDEKLQVPFICNLGREVWKAKECRLPSDEMIGDQETRGILMEAITASCMLMAGGELMIMRHPRAVSLTKSLINGLMG
ncbi:MAG: acetyl-CoA decarbonylase/synthase complex subunit delta [Desulfurivibrionaceae bacterium]|nr:acetyl-CoA decarbonylase/synthase complex subunit delta [Pseudomonadota bacterium]MDP2003581.1 acetyl-CoA decarbonylase/synthase complex subunit delta [Desulfurivibrionaceae bacterium]